MRRSVNQGDTLLTRNIGHTKYLWGQNIQKNMWSKRIIKMVL